MTQRDWRMVVIGIAIGGASVVLGLIMGTLTAKAGERVIASNYHEDRWTATGARFNRELMAAAHKTLPFGTKLTLRHGHRMAVVTINDRGPYVRGRTLDLTPAAKKQLGCNDLCRVTMEPWPPLPKPRPYIEQTFAWGVEEK